MNELIKLIERRIEGLFSVKYGIFKAGLVIIFTSVVLQFLFFPALGLQYIDFLKMLSQRSIGGEIHQIISEQASSITKPFENSEFTYENHRFKMMYRLFLPFLVRFLSVKNIPLFIFLTQLLLVFGYVYLLLKWLIDVTKDNISAFYITFLLGGTYVISSFWMDTSGYGDAFAYFFLLITIYSRNPFLVFTMAFCAAWIDERAFVCLGGILLWKSYYEHISRNSYSIKVTRDSIAILAVLILYGVIRIYLGRTIFKPYMVNTDFISEYISVSYENIKNLGFSIWRGYKGLFAINLFLLLILIKEKRIGIVLTYNVPFYLCILLAFGAYDLSRSLNFFYPFILFSAVTLRKYLSQSEFRTFLLFIILATIYCSNFSAFRLTGGFTLQ